MKNAVTVINHIFLEIIFLLWAMTIQLHKFHVPVMGLAYTIDSPIKVAPFGIASVISIMEDRLIESMRNYYYHFIGETYHPISDREDNCRERRITDYLNLVEKIVAQKIEKIKTAAFEKGSEIVQYFEMLPDDSAVKKLYAQFQKLTNTETKEVVEEKLRNSIVPGSIDVNIMTKVDKDNYDKHGTVIENGSDALVALKAYAHSNLAHSSVVFSAGMNPRLYNYLENFPQFDINEDGSFNKTIVIKVSDYRSALIQGKYLAKKGIWVSEFRIESGLNCGGHAFATDGLLMGPILEEFKNNKQSLINALFEIYAKAVVEKKGITLQNPPQLKITAQGGVGTHAESDFLLNYYGIESVGWGTPFLLVPEATTVDDDTLQLLQNAGSQDICLSKKSPLGVRFHFLKNTSADKERLQRIENNKPGSPCTEKLLASNTEFTDKPICTASSKYQKLKIEQLRTLQLPQEELDKRIAEVLDKDCLCINLSNAATTKYNVPFIKKLKAATICPGPNIVYFSKTVSLQKMTDHIYGRTNILNERVKRPHVFINELHLYVNYFKELVEAEVAVDKKRQKYIVDFFTRLQQGIAYYKEIADAVYASNDTLKTAFVKDLDAASVQLNLYYENFEATVSCAV